MSRGRPVQEHRVRHVDRKRRALRASTAASGSIPLATDTIGSKKVTASASDNVGHPTSVDCNYRVIFDFGGFNKPVANAPTLNP